MSDYPRLGYKSSLDWKISDEIVLPRTDPKDHQFVVALTTDKNYKQEFS